MAGAWGPPATGRPSPPSPILHRRFEDPVFDGANVAVLHGEDREGVEALAEGGGFDDGCYGHHHVTWVRAAGGMNVVNPGVRFTTAPEEHRRVAVVGADSDEVEQVWIEDERFRIYTQRTLAIYRLPSRHL